MPKRMIRSLLARLGYELRKRGNSDRLDLTLILAALNAMTRERGLFVAQVGANDGVTNDPLYPNVKRFASRLLLIEPQAVFIDKLRKNYEDFNGELYIERKLISSRSGMQKLYVLCPEASALYRERCGLNPTVIASCRKNHIEKQLMRHLKIPIDVAHKYIDIEEQEAVSLEYVLNKNHMLPLDFLQIDVEGADWDVLLSLGALTPAVINFERRHMSQHTWETCSRWLKGRGYGLISHGPDCMAVLGYR